MKFLRAFLPHLAVAMLLGLVVLIILDGFNPLMAFLTSNVSKLYMLIMCLVSIAVIISALVRQHK